LLCKSIHEFPYGKSLFDSQFLTFLDFGIFAKLRKAQRWQVVALEMAQPTARKAFGFTSSNPSCTAL
jgi:hypothetical protein